MGLKQLGRLKACSNRGKCFDIEVQAILKHIFPFMSNFSHIMKFSLFFSRKLLFYKDGKFTKCLTLLFLKLFLRKRAQVHSFTKTLPKDHISLSHKSELRIFAYFSTIDKYMSIFGLFCAQIWTLTAKILGFWTVFVILACG